MYRVTMMTLIRWRNTIVSPFNVTHEHILCTMCAFEEKGARQVRDREIERERRKRTKAKKHLHKKTSACPQLICLLKHFAIVLGLFFWPLLSPSFFFLSSCFQANSSNEKHTYDMYKSNRFRYKTG